MYEKPYYFDPFYNMPQDVPPGQGGAQGTVPPQYTAGNPYQVNQGGQMNGGVYQPPQANQYQYHQGQYQSPYGAPNQYPPYGRPQAPVLDAKAMEQLNQANIEKQQIAKKGNAAGALLLIFFLFASIFSFILYKSPLGQLYSRSSFMEHGVYIFYSILCVGGAAWLATMKPRKETKRTILPFKKVAPADTVVYVIVGFALCMLANIVTNIIVTMLSGFGIESNAGGDSTPVTSVFGLILAIVASAVIPALVEECAFRGAVMQPLRDHGDSAAIWITAVLFGIFHGNLQQIPFAFLVGLVLAFVTVKTGSIVPAILIHFINNANSVIIGYLSDNYGDTKTNTIFYILMAVVCVAAIVSVLFTYLRGRGDMFRMPMEQQVQISRNPYALTTGKKVAAFFTAPCMIVGWIAVILQVFASTTLNWA